MKDRNSLEMTPKPDLKEQIDKPDHIDIRDFSSLKNAVERMKRSH